MQIFYSLQIIYLIQIFQHLNANNDNTRLIYNLSSGLYKADEIFIQDNQVYVHKLLAIPYANVPFTFEKSTLKTSTDSSETTVHNNSIIRPACIEARMFADLFYGNFQTLKNTRVQYDCLTIDIYIPKSKKKSNNKNMSVLFFIHGGSNASGTSSTFDGSILAAYGDVIVAIPNYRLDVLGFFHSKLDNINGNYGLWDQVVALQWLTLNCPQLGCNSESITVFGHSAGAANAMLLAMSPKAQPYIKRLIIQSGSAISHWAMDNFESSNEHPVWQTKTKSVAISFLQHTTCAKTRKYECLKANLEQKLSNLINMENFDSYIIYYLKNITETHKHNGLIQIFNYLIMRKSEIQEQVHQRSGQNTKDVLNEYKYKRKNKREKRSTSNVATTNNQTQLIFDYSNDHAKQCIEYFQNTILNNTKDTLCYEFLTTFSFNFAESVFKKKIYVFKHDIIKSFLNCYHLPYASETGKKDGNNKITLNFKLIIDEMKQCIDDSVNETLFNLDKSNNTNIINEIGSLIDKESLLFTPIVDNDLIVDNPHKLLKSENFLKIDLLIGLTAQESFLMIEHDYKLSEVFEQILNQAYYLNLLNIKNTENVELINKTINDKKSSLKHNDYLNNCLKNNIYSFYNQLNKQVFASNKTYFNNNRNISNNLVDVDLLSDYDIRLPYINLLSFKAEYQLKARNFKNISNSRLFAYEFTYPPSFNYLLDYAKTRSKVLMDAHKLYDYKVSSHYTELDYVFGLPILSKLNYLEYKNDKYSYKYTDMEYNISLLIIKYWTNFAKYG